MVEVASRNAGGDGSEEFPGDAICLLSDFGGGDVGAKEFDVVAGLAIGEGGDVGHDLVHGDAAEERAAGVADEDFGFVSGEGAGVAVAVADADGGNAGGSVEDGGASVGNALAGREVTDEGDAGLEGHDGTKFLLKCGEGRNAVEHEAGSDEVGGARFVSEEASGIAQVDSEFRMRKGEGLDEGVELVELLAGEVGVFVGGGEVGAESGEAEVGERLDVGDGVGRLIGEDAAAAHAGVDGEVDGEGGVCCCGEGVEVGGLVEGRDAGGPVVGDDFFVFVIEAGAEEVDGGGDASGGQAAGFADVGHTEEGEIVVIDGTGEVFESVAVGACFNDRHDVLATALAGHGEVVAEGGKVDFRPSSWGADGGRRHTGEFDH